MKQLKKVFFNMSMTNGSFNGVEIYSLKLKDQILQSKTGNPTTRPTKKKKKSNTSEKNF